ncbi:Uncharacterized protein Fot_51879 [Forsythia ovata]|uniref:Aminotransferase-like plant mobile domain-containing protein n=1 Tax=Forsythia ovata TaxID=205694 RepID=A0ABD1PZJ6_9LAMI
MGLLENVADVKNYAWGAALLACIHHQLSIIKKAHLLNDGAQRCRVFPFCVPFLMIIDWQPFARLPADFLPSHLLRQVDVGYTSTILICFEQIGHHLPYLAQKFVGWVALGYEGARTPVVLKGDFFCYTIRRFKTAGVPRSLIL